MADIELLKSLIPISSLRTENFDQLASRTKIEQVPAKSTLFKAGDSDPDTIYLLRGELTLTPTKGDERVIVGGTPDARYALAQLKPRQFTGTVPKNGSATIARVDGALLDRLLTMDQTGGYEVSEIDAEDGEWVFSMMRHPAFEKLPAANMSGLFGRLESMDVKPGQVLIKQGDPGDYYYIIKTGRVNVSRKSDKDGKVTVLGELKDGDSFGEEALVSGAPRNANVIALTPGTLMRLAKSDFDQLLREPLVKQVTLPEVQKMAQGGAVLIDVRTEAEFGQGSVKGAINLPLYALRLKAKALDSAKKYVVCCQTGNRSAAAAFLMSQRGFDVCVLRGGLNAIGRV
ncbi:MAG TPA: cyclic nucleotide-binding domain-containing protein [Burkholderiales bacterium]|nr:cyclic nucleotide-binding domain-containing protein [Burkholderiales bacterium]